MRATRSEWPQVNGSLASMAEVRQRTSPNSESRSFSLACTCSRWLSSMRRASIITRRSAWPNNLRGWKLSATSHEPEARLMRGQRRAARPGGRRLGRRIQELADESVLEVGRGGNRVDEVADPVRGDGLARQLEGVARCAGVPENDVGVQAVARGLQRQRDVPAGLLALLQRQPEALQHLPRIPGPNAARRVRRVPGDGHGASPLMDPLHRRRTASEATGEK